MDEDKSFEDLLDEYQVQEGITHFEGISGLRSLNKICRAIGYQESPFGSGSSVEEFLKDNPGAMCAIIEWLAESDVPSFREELISNLTEEESDE